MNLSNKVIAITGGTKGLGLSMAKIFAEKGAKVAICSRDIQNIENFLVFKADVTEESELSAFAEKIISQFGRIDIWINNAGIWMPPVSIENMDMEKAHSLINVNLFGTINGSRVAKRNMKNGIIMNIGSTTAFDGMNGSSGAMYVASKYALRGLTNVLREELKPDIQVIGVYPGGFKTDIFIEAVPKNFDQFMSVEDVAEKIVMNLELSEPETQLIIKRPGQHTSDDLK